MARQIYNMRVEGIRDHNPQIREIWLKTEEPKTFQFQAGQFVTLHVPNPEKPEKPFLRAYSIASDDRKTDGLNLIFKYVEGGVASRYVWDLKGGEVLNFTGPFGRVFFKEPASPQVIFLNTGSGISQHLSYLLSRAEKFPETDFKLLFGVRTEADIYYQEELKALKDKLPHFDFEYVLSRPAGPWAGRKGYVQNHIEAFDYLNKETTFYLCGNGDMIKETKKFLIEEKNFDRSRLFAEAFD